MMPIETGTFSHSLEEIDAAVDALPGKQDALTFDTKPTSESTNPVTSGGIFDEIYITSTEIASGSDLDSSEFRIPGRYRIASATIANTIQNIPYKASGSYLIVEKVSDIVIQTLYSVTTAGSNYYKRIIGSINVGSWFSFPNDSRLASIVYGTGTEIVIDSETPANNDLDNFRTAGVYYSSGNSVSRDLTHCPFTAYGFRLEVRAVGTARCSQFLYPMTRQSTHTGEGEFYYRQYGVDSNWTTWYKFSGTAVST